MSQSPAHLFVPGDRVCADSRPGFPSGTVEGILDEIYLLVRWDGDVLETADHRKLRTVAKAVD
jgi:hypothetical protein